MASNTQTFTTTVFLNTEQAKNRIEELRKQMEKLRQARRTALQTGDEAAFKSLNAQLKACDKEMNTLSTTAQSVDRVLKNLSTTGIKDLRRTINAINRELASGNVARGSKEWDFLTQSLAKCNAEMKRIKAESAAATEMRGGFFNQLKNGINESWASLLTLKGVMQQAAQWVSGYVQRYADMEEAMANVTKYTGQTTQEIHAMQTELKAMDTRTSIEGLNELAGAAGRLGITAKDKILEFVDAADKINVALGDDLGEGAVDQIGKLAMAFGEDETMGLRGAMLATGSAINELSANSAAGAGYLVDFAARLAGVGQTAGLTQTQIMGFGAVMDETMQRDETATTALTQLISKMATDTATFAKITNTPLKEFADLVENDMNGALLKLFSTLKGKNSFPELAQVLPEMKMKGTQAAQVFAVIADKLQDVERYQRLASDAYKDGTSVMNEFDVQNNTVQAQMDKTRKRADELATSLGEALFPAVNNTMDAFDAVRPALTSFISIVATVIKWVAQHTAVLVTLTAAVVAYRVQQALANKETLLAKTYTTAASVAHTAYATAVGVATGKIRLATIAQAAFNAAAKAFPLIAVGVIAAMTRISLKMQEMRKQFNDPTGGEAAADNSGELAKQINTLVARYNVRVKKVNELIRKRKSMQDQGFQDLDGFTNQIDDLKKELNERLKVINDYKQKLAKMRGSKGTPALAQGNGESGNAGNAGNGNAAGGTPTSTTPSPSERAVKELRQRYQLELAYEADRYAQGLETQEQYVENSKAIQEKMFADELAALEAHGQKDSDEWKQIQLERQQAQTEAANKLRDLSLTQLEQQHQAEQALLKAQASDPTSSLYGDEEALNTALLESDLKYLREKQSRYKQSSDEWGAIEAEINQRQTDDQLRKQEQYQQQLGQMRQKYATESAAASLAEELNALDALAEAIPQKADEIERMKAEARKRYATDGGQGSDMLDRAKKKTADGDTDSGTAATGGWGDMATGLAGVWDAVSQQKQVNDALAQLYQEDLEACGDNAEAKAAVTEQYNAAVEQNNSQTWKSVMAAATAALQGISSIMSSVSAYSQACSDLETAKIEKNYEKQINAAGKNSRKKEKLEKERDAKLAEAKTKANKKAMKIELAQAFASTALAAINSYASASKTNWLLGAVAAAMATAAGLMQIATIKKQHEAEQEGYYKGGFVGGSLSPTLSKGEGGRKFALGGFTGGRSYRRAAGIVHEGEFVANHETVNNADILPALQLIDQAQRDNAASRLTSEELIRSLSPALPIRGGSRGYASGGFVGSSQLSQPSQNSQNSDNEALRRTLQQTAEAVDSLQASLRAGITAKVQLDGTDGLDAQYRRYKRLR